MSREIKFRFWSKILKKFVIPDSYILQGSFKDPEMVALQYTGLKDKNGVEIFEGDIVKVTTDSDNGFRGHYSELNSEVVWSDDKSGWYLPLGFDTLGSALIDGDVTIEVIGNIYENPELLEAV